MANLPHTSGVHDFRKLFVWQQARSLATDIHALARSFPRADRQVIASQLRRSALSIAANIAEGCGKSSRAETIRLLQIAAGSAAETEHHLIIAGDLGYISSRASEDLTSRAIAIRRMLRALSQNLPR